MTKVPCFVTTMDGFTLEIQSVHPASRSLTRFTPHVTISGESGPLAFNAELDLEQTRRLGRTLIELAVELAWEDNAGGCE